MLACDQIEELICLVAATDRPGLTRLINEYRATFPLDFSDEFLNTVPIERLRHIFVALCLQQQHVPDLTELTAV